MMVIIFHIVHVMGNRHERAAYFTRGTGHDEGASLSENPEEWVENLDRLLAKEENAKDLAPKPILTEKHNAKIGIIAYGSTHQTIPEVQYLLTEDGIETS